MTIVKKIKDQASQFLYHGRWEHGQKPLDFPAFAPALHFGICSSVQIRLEKRKKAREAGGSWDFMSDPFWVCAQLYERPLFETGKDYICNFNFEILEAIKLCGVTDSG